ncbi:hypothetical protein FXB40_23945 [Bradyrhizobium rifense]|uniref:Uncharacterized protein n=1 Tax=Bradyrhizobium rifense TaxID=515499 RepID=A0A5D3KLZ6_9BRAD|nr:hypothetical protein [Bradyrhizobium rifense]TYL92743.1 hypothetical protein FXB40_23945 [Bradyrhizobium rifense]
MLLCSCQGDIAKDISQTETIDVLIGTLELMESAAWLLEKRVVHALQIGAQIVPAPIFPYEVAAALGKHLAPNVNEDGLLACILAALQSSDAPAAFPEILRSMLPRREMIPWRCCEIQLAWHSSRAG